MTGPALTPDQKVCEYEASKWQARGDSLHYMAREGHARFLVPGDADPGPPFGELESRKLRAALALAARLSYQAAGHYRRMVGELAEGGE